jgi:hypothetical protein
MPYTYLIGWSKNKKYYYGVRYSKKSHPDDLWQTYFTSSKHVKEYMIEHGSPDIIKIRKIFDDVDSARKWETRVLKKLSVKDREDFLNQTDNISISLEACQRGQQKIDYKKMGESLKKFYLEADENYIKQIKKNRYLGLLNKSEISAKRQSEGIRKYQKESWSDPEIKKKRSESMRKPKSKIKCNYCNLVGGSGIMKRWHFDNCKHKNPGE